MFNHHIQLILKSLNASIIEYYKYSDKLKLYNQNSVEVFKIEDYTKQIHKSDIKLFLNSINDIENGITNEFSIQIKLKDPRNHSDFSLTNAKGVLADKETGLLLITLENIKKEEETDILCNESVQKMIEKNKKLKSITRLSNKVMNSTNFNETAKNLFKECKSIIGASSGYIALLNTKGDENEVLYLDTGGVSCYVDPQLPMPIRGLRKIAYESGNVEYDNFYCDSPHCKYMPKGHVKLDNVMFAPLFIDEKVIGLLGLGNKPGGFNQEDVDLAKRIAEFVSIALFKSNLITQLELERKNAKEANKAKSDFLAVMSHEIRTPLTGIIGSSQLLQTYSLSDDQKKYVEVINTSSTLLLDIINKILDLSKIESGTITITNERCDFYELIECVINIVQYKASEKGIRLSTNIDKNLPKCIKTDPLRLKQILTNLLYNAIKFTDEGSVELKIKRQNFEQKQANLTFSVKDTGIGISEKNISKILEPYNQENNRIENQYGGTGLGLSITNTLLKLMDSTLFITSKTGKGSVFLFDLRVSLAESEKKKPKQSKISLDHSKFSKILIVEDDLINMEITTRMIKEINSNFIVLRAYNGKEAMKLYQTTTPDLILLDISLPDFDGHEITKIIRKENKTIPIIAITANVFSDVKEQSLSEGMNAFITKPFEIEELYNVILSLESSSQ